MNSYYGNRAEKKSERKMVSSHMKKNPNRKKVRSMKEKQVKQIINRPVKKWRAGNIEAALWVNRREVDGADVEFKTVSLSRNYKKRGEEIWRSDVINSLRRNDLQKAILVLQKAQEALILHEEASGE